MCKVFPVLLPSACRGHTHDTAPPAAMHTPDVKCDISAQWQITGWHRTAYAGVLMRRMHAYTRLHGSLETYAFLSYAVRHADLKTLQMQTCPVRDFAFIQACRRAASTH
jgi:hypothetical protein